MARETRRLNARQVVTLTDPGLYADGDGLYLRVDAAGAKRWSFIFQWPHPDKPGTMKRTEMGLGRLADIGLADARERAADARRLIADGENPIEARNAAATARKAVVVTFGIMADRYINSQATGFRNERHVAQWRMTLGDTYCAELRSRPVDRVNTEDVLGVLQPIWLTKSETASRIRGRIERVLDAAKAKELRTGENPARWRGHLDKLLAKRLKLSRGHHAAMPYANVPAFVVRLAASGDVGALALSFLILTAGRTGEVLGAVWSEIDLDKAVWTVPAKRMKAGREHRVALSASALAVLSDLNEKRTGNYVFTAGSQRPIGNHSLSKALSTAGGADYTVHGFRSSFRDWVSEETSFPGELAEAALAHVSGDATERAYRRGDALEKRRKLMEAWANYCLSSSSSNVVSIKRTKTTA